MLDKLVLEDKDYEYLTRGIASGVGIGTIVGMFLSNIEFFFAFGGVVGILASGIYIACRKVKKNK